VLPVTTAAGAKNRAGGRGPEGGRLKQLKHLPFEIGAFRLGYPDTRFISRCRERHEAGLAIQPSEPGPSEGQLFDGKGRLTHRVLRENLRTVSLFAGIFASHQVPVFWGNRGWQNRGVNGR